MISRVVAWGALLALYLALVSAVSPTELVVGAALAVLCVLTAVAARRAERLSFPWRAAWLRGLAPVPVRVVRDTLRMPRSRAGGYDEIRLARVDPALAPAYRAVRTLVVSLSPGTYVRDVDPDHGARRTARPAGGAGPGRAADHAAAPAAGRRVRPPGLPRHRPHPGAAVAGRHAGLRALPGQDAVIAAVLVWCGTAVAVASAAGLLLVRDRATRLHYVAPATSVAAPLIGTGLALAGWSSVHDILKIVVITVLLVATGPITVVATARAAGRRDSDG